jgi:hypothetical protein
MQILSFTAASYVEEGDDLSDKVFENLVVGDIYRIPSTKRKKG